MAESTVLIGLTWHSFGHGNLGVDALARSDKEILEAAARKAGVDVAFRTMGTVTRLNAADLPTNVTEVAGASLKELAKGNFDFLREVRQCDLIVDIGEGDSFADIYGLKRFLTQCYSKMAAKVFGKPLILAPQTVGPFARPWTRWLAKQVMDRADVVFARDHMTRSYLETMKISAPIDEFVDVAFRLPYDRSPRSPSVVRVGINVSGLLYFEGYSGQNEFGMHLDYRALQEKLIEQLLERDALEVHLFAHVSGSGGHDDDRLAIQELSRRFPAARVVEPFSSAIRAKSWISGLDFVVAGRMHACIGAYSAGVPVVPIAYSRKFNGLFGTLGYDYFVDGLRVTTQDALASILLWFDQRQQLAARIEESVDLIGSRLNAYEEHCGRIIRAVAARKAAKRT